MAKTQITESSSEMLSKYCFFPLWNLTHEGRELYCLSVRWRVRGLQINAWASLTICIPSVRIVRNPQRYSSHQPLWTQSTINSQLVTYVGRDEISGDLGLAGIAGLAAKLGTKTGATLTQDQLIQAHDGYMWKYFSF